MKRTLLTAAALILVGTAWAQDPATNKKREKKRWSPKTTVFVLGEQPAQEQVKIVVEEEFKRSFKGGFQEVKAPLFVVTDRKARAAFSIGGFVNFRTAYDFNRVMPNLDFVPYDLTQGRSPMNAERLLMDGSTSRLFFKTIVRTGRGPLEAYVESDFRGPGNSLRLRQAYVSFLGITAGQTVSTFTDPNASFNTIDFEGPNGYTYNRNLMLRYAYAWKNGLSAALALEFPVVSATYAHGSNQAIPQRVPDIPFYLQYGWKTGHVRASGILRNMYYYNEARNQTIDQLGWGAQLSGSWSIGPVVELYGQVVYGQGITPYIQDLQGSAMDLIPSHTRRTAMATPDQMGWLLGAQFNLTRNIPLTVGYSQVSQWGNALQPSDYRLGQYVVGNLFYNWSSLLSVGVEYLYGTRYNIDGTHGEANRIQMAVQVNF